METPTSGPGPQTFIAKTISGLEEVLAAELVALGAPNVQLLKRAVSFDGDKRMLYKANYCLRTAQRILMPIFSFQLADDEDLYNQVNGYPWENYLDLQKTLAVDAVVTDSELTHSHFVALRTKDGIVDRFRTLNNGRRPSVDVDNPNVRINIHINGSVCDVSLDSSGASLHKRGYRVSNAEAPMSEVLAAGLIQLSGWKRDGHFIDPMCGSGTLVIEAAMFANNFPAGMYRKDFGFMHWPDFDQQLWDDVTAEALGQQTEFEYQIIGSDISPKNLGSARANLKAARLHKDVKLHVSPFAAMQPPAGKRGIVIINPPYGERIRMNDIIGLYKSIGNTLKQEFTGYQAWVISSDQKALSLIGLRPTGKYPIFNGQLECRFVHYDLYKGSKKDLYADGVNLVAGKHTDNHQVTQNTENKEHATESAAKKREYKPREPLTDERVEKGFRKKETPDPRKSSRYDDMAESGGSFRKKEGREKEGGFRNSERPLRDSNAQRDYETDAAKEEFVEKELTWLEMKSKSKPETFGKDSDENTEVPETKPESKWTKFLDKRDYEIKRPKELRPRKPKTEKPVEKPAEKKPIQPIDYDDLED